MHKRISLAVSLLLCVCALSFGFNTRAVKSSIQSETTKSGVITVSNNKSVKSDILESRFLNMLNHSFVYDNDFYDDEILVNNSILALLDLAQDGFVKESYVSDYIFDMYGKIFTDFSEINVGLEQKQGYVYVVPRGYSICTHKIVSVIDNEDGSYTVVTNVEISLDDGSVINDTATTVFLKNSESQFGFNIVYSEIGAVNENTIDC